MARIGTWEVNLINNTVRWSRMTKEIHEVNKDYEPELATAINFYKEGISRENILNAVTTAIKDGTTFDLELELVTAMGNVVWTRSIGQAEFKNGICIRLYGVFQDINAIKKAEKTLIEFNKSINSINKQLNQKNEELEQFAYIAAHDLQEPLRMISSFLSLLEQKYAHQLDDKAKKYIHYSVDGALRMRDIIRDILDFSKSGTVNNTSLDLNSLVNTIVSGYQHDEKYYMFS